MNKKFLKHLQNELTSIIGEGKSMLKIENFSGIFGGDINRAFRLELANSSFLFLKLNSVQKLSMFEAEQYALDTIFQSQSIKVPKPLLTGTYENYAYLVMEYIEFGRTNSRTHIQFGRQLAKMHQHMHDNFGFAIDNTIGSTPQYNEFKSSWLEFWRDNRMLPQLKIAEKNGSGSSLRAKGEKLLAKLDDFFGPKPQASLLHGDLWSGNHAADSLGNPVIFDPASYYGDRECDLAMTELFGRCPQGFYDAYNEVWPLLDGYKRRRTLYNIYHIVNHFNLFRGGYADQAERMIDSL